MRFISKKQFLIIILISLFISFSVIVATGFILSKKYSVIGTACDTCQEIVPVTVDSYGYPLTYRNIVEGGVPYGVNNIAKFEPYNFMLDILLISLIIFGSLTIIFIVGNKIKSRKTTSNN